MARAADFILIMCTMLQAVDAGVLLQSPRGSNNRMAEASNVVRNQRRMFDSRNINRGGYNMGDRFNSAAKDDASKQYLMEYFMSGRDVSVDDTKKTSLWLEWTNDEGCGTSTAGENQQAQMNCNVIIQFNCRPPSNDKDNMREGTSHDTNDYRHSRDPSKETSTEFEERKNSHVKDYRGVHETYEEYEKCHNRRGNAGLYTGDVQLRSTRAIHTRQNPNGDRFGYECPEERDYYPYWHPTSWRDIAVMAHDKSFCENYYQKESFNVKTKYECMMKFPDNDQYHAHSSYNNENECIMNGGQWLEFTNYLEFAPQHTTASACTGASDNAIKYVWGRPMGHMDERCMVALGAPECHEAQWTRPNHFGNAFKTGEPANYEWKLPHFPSGDSQHCVLRIRYNVTSADFNAQQADSTQNYADYIELADASGSIESACPLEKGFCINRAGHDQNHGVVKVNGDDGDTDAARKTCLKACLAKSGATGCEVIWNQGNRGCYIHTADVSRGNNHNNHACWVLKRCKGKGPQGFSPNSEFGVNLAYEKLTTQSSTDHGGWSGRAVDGNSNAHWHGGSCTHTDRQTDPWWRVDLGASKKIDMLYILNRGDCCQDRLSHFRVTIGDNVNGDDNAVCKADGGNTAHRKEIEVHCDQPLEGRYVEIKVPGDDKEFTLCEVYVLEYDPNNARPKNIAEGKYATQSSTAHGGLASRITDGNAATNWHGGSCQHTQHETNPWVRVDLGGAAIVNHIQIFNRRDGGQDRLSGYVVTVGDNHLGIGNAQCGATGGNTAHREKIDLYCDPALKGRYVHVKLSGRKILNICEVKVFGEGGGNAQPTGIDTAGQSQINENLETSTMKVMCKKVSLGSFPVYDRHGEMTVGEEVVAGSKTTVVAWKNLKGQRGACQWIGFQSNDFNQKTLKFNAWINFVGALPTDSELRRGNFGLKVCGKFYNSFMTNAVADTWIHINEEVQCNGGDGRHIIMIFDNLQTQDQVIKMHSVSLKDPSLDVPTAQPPTTPPFVQIPFPNSLPSVEEYKSVGCFKDVDGDHAIPSVEGSCGLIDGDPNRRVDAIAKCYKCAKLAGNKYFALHDSGACMTSSTAKDTYQKHGASDDCNDEGTGGPSANEVYEIVASNDGGITPPTSAPYVHDATFQVHTNPILETGVKNLRLQIAMRSKNVYSTHQDRTHVFKMNARPANIAENLIHNLNVRGKRGNIVQTFPSHEYDFFPTDLRIKEEELVHIQWTGSNTNDRGNAGEGTAGTDRSNIVQIADRSVNYPITPLKDAPMFMNAKVHWAAEYSSKNSLEPIDVAIQMASSGFIQCEKDCCYSAEGPYRHIMQDQLNDAPASFGGMVLSFAKGEYHYMCSRNNNFSNRAQKASLFVE